MDIDTLVKELKILLLRTPSKQYLRTLEDTGGPIEVLRGWT